jgi:glycosyltransferase involved in cell wall biosynthesis
LNILLLSSRFPWPPFTGDRLRATIWLSALERKANVAMVSPRGRIPAGAPRFRFYPVERSLARGVAGSLRVLAGAPVQALLSASFDWRGAIARARNEFGDFDATIVLLSRLDPSVRRSLPNGFHMLDAIDSLRSSMIERSREAPRITRWFWREESRRIGRVEQDAAHSYDRVLVVSAQDSAELGATVISNGALIAPLADAPRRFDFAFWGRLTYFANADAAAWLLDEVWPAIRALRPEATLLIAGIGAPARVRAADGRDGITVRSPAESIPALAREVNVALFPVRYGTGESTKVLEAAEAGCAIVATSKAMRGVEALARHAHVADDTASLARAAIAAISNETDRTARARALRAAVESGYGRQQTLDRLFASLQRD